MHLEAVLKIVLKNAKAFGNLRYNYYTLGKATHKITDMNIIDEKITDILFKYVILYNKAKHEVYMIEEKSRLSVPSDAIVSYFGARIVGQLLLKQLKHPESLRFYCINNKFEGETFPINDNKKYID